MPPALRSGAAPNEAPRTYNLFPLLAGPLAGWKAPLGAAGFDYRSTAASGGVSARRGCQWRRPRGTGWNAAPLTKIDNGRWSGRFPLAVPGRHTYTFEAWGHLFASRCADMLKKRDAGHPPLAKRRRPSARDFRRRYRALAVCARPGPRRTLFPVDRSDWINSPDKAEQQPDRRGRRPGQPIRHRQRRGRARRTPRRAWHLR